jgi:hypothetical protein
VDRGSTAQASGLPEDAVNEGTHFRLFVIKKFVDSMAWKTDQQQVNEK